MSVMSSVYYFKGCEPTFVTELANLLDYAVITA